MRGGWTIGVAIAVALALPALAAEARLDGALAMVTRFAVLSGNNDLQSPEAKAMVSGELEGMIEPTFGPLLPPDTVLAAEGGGAVVRVPAQGLMPDVYFYAKPAGNGWTIHALRTMALPPLIYRMRDELAATPSRNAEQEALLRNLDLTSRSDAELRRWFGMHRAELDTMRGLTGLAAEAAAERLHGTKFEWRDGIGAFTIGGIVDNHVGFLFVPEGKQPPAISPGDTIWIEPMDGGWYLFRTT